MSAILTAALIEQFTKGVSLALTAYLLWKKRKE